MCDSIAITGIGLLAADKIGIAKHLDFPGFSFPVGEVDYSNEQLKALLNIPESQMVSRTSLLGIYAAKQAAHSAGVQSSTNNRCVLISGTTVGGMDLTERYWHNIENNPNVMIHHDCGACSNAIADYFGFFNQVTTISTACSSGANAILLGAELLQSGKADIVFAGGAEALTKFHLSGFASLMILDKAVCRPFQPDRAGLNLGEGAAYVVMETTQHAQQRGAKILCYYRGGGNACDAFHQTASSSNGEGAYLAMSQALDNAGLLPKDIQYVNAHGTGTVNNDDSETAALNRVFGNSLPVVESTKSITGHTTSAAGAIEAVLCIKKMQENSSLVNVMNNSFGFGGNDTSLIFSVNPCALDKYTYSNDIEIETLAKSEITSEDDLDDIKQYLKPSEYRRMGTILRSSLLTSLRALKESNITVPDAIITATTLGCWNNSEKILDNLPEPMPTLFMQSTHNTIGSNIAIYLKCHGYNITYTQGASSLQRAIDDATLLIKSGRCKNVLVGLHEETTDRYRNLMKSNGIDQLPLLYSMSMVLTAKK
ncbi:MAG: beta-ketoacyl-[acyl-carrier-protein] synthase family protein [Bacteroidales bacterium]|nr:beta-ketoacyl-[acyl-carrier-protein] synthase family protein [Bacteroidales bacterium]